jgi:hypothetical protein
LNSKRGEECFQCRELDKEEHQAIKALYRGDATEYQQRLALKVIINVFSRTHDMPFIPGAADQTAFMNGRAFVGQKLLKYLNIPIGKLQEEEDDGENTQS